MVNKELIDLCRLVVAAIQDTDSFDSRQLKKLLLHIVPQLLAEIDILAAVASSLSANQEPVEPAAVPAQEEPSPVVARDKKPAPKPRSKKGKRRGR